MSFLSSAWFVGVTASACCVALVAHFWLGVRTDFRQWRETQLASQAVNVGASSASQSKRLRVLTHNVWCHYFVPAPLRRQRLQLLIDHLERNDGNFDVLLFQELFVARLGPFYLFNELDFMTRELRRLGFVYSTDCGNSLHATSTLFPIQNSGLVSFSKLPMNNAKFTAFSKTRERLNNKGFEQFDVTLSDGSVVHCVNTHFDSKPLHRADQIAQLGQALAPNVIGNGCSMLAAGDFNIDSHSTSGEFGALSRALAADDCVAQRRLGATFRPKPKQGSLVLQQLLGIRARWYFGPGAADSMPRSKHFNECLDHVFLRHLSAQQCSLLDVHNGKLPLSDHLGVVCDVKFK